MCIDQFGLIFVSNNFHVLKPHSIHGNFVITRGRVFVLISSKTCLAVMPMMPIISLGRFVMRSECKVAHRIPLLNAASPPLPVISVGAICHRAVSAKWFAGGCNFEPKIHPFVPFSFIDNIYHLFLIPQATHVQFCL